MERILTSFSGPIGESNRIDCLTRLRVRCIRICICICLDLFAVEFIALPIPSEVLSIARISVRTLLYPRFLPSTSSGCGNDAPPPRRFAT
jgi:hypothetical protein